MAKEKKEKPQLQRDIFGQPERKKGINGRQKGVANERECAKTMKFYTGSEFTRVPSSGGLRWKDSRGVTSDLVSTNADFDFPFVVETKHLSRFNESIVCKVWKQVHRDAVRGRKMPMAMLRRNGMVKFNHDYEAYRDYYVFFAESFLGTQVAMKVKPDYKITVQLTKEESVNIYGFLFSKLYKVLPYEKIRSAAERGKYLDRFLTAYPTPS